MTPEQFFYWIKGYADIEGTSSPTHAEWQKIKDMIQQVSKPLIDYNRMDYIPNQLGQKDIFNTGIYQKMMLTETPLGIGDQTPFLGNTTCESSH